jgi:hypothetical protein
MKFKKYIIAIIILIVSNYSYAQMKLDSLQILKDVNGGSVVFTPIAANAITWGNGYGTNNMAFIAALRSYTTSLPVKLVAFKAIKEAQVVKLVWKTQSEQNSDYFEILRSNDGKKFTAIGIVKAAGNSNTILNYYYKDVNPLGGTNYYQLNMVDLDGTSEKSNIIFSNFDLQKLEFNVQTNSSKETISITVESEKTKESLLEVFDINGIKLISKNLKLERGVNSFELKLKTNAKMIIVQLNYQGEKQAKKVLY